MLFVMTIMGIRETFLVVLYLTSIVSATKEHEPKVHEDLPEDMPEITRTARHSEGSQRVFQLPAFNYRTARQQDRLQEKYFKQQQADFRHFKSKKSQEDLSRFNAHQSQNRRTPMSISLEESESDWKPIQPNYLVPVQTKTHATNRGKGRFIESRHQINDIVHENYFGADLEIAESENKENKVNTDRTDDESRFIYVQPNILEKNFGLDPKTTHEILRNSAPGTTEGQETEQFQISELQELLGKNPEAQLEGLQKLLEGASPSVENHLPAQVEPEGIDIKHNGSPILSQDSLEGLQKQIDAINKAHADAAIEAAQKQAEAHVNAQRQAIALAQEKAQAAAFAKIAAHNGGSSPNVPASVTGAPITLHSPMPQSDGTARQIVHNSLESHPGIIGEEDQAAQYGNVEAQALHARPYEEILLQVPHMDGTVYEYPSTNLRASKPIINNSPIQSYQSESFAKNLESSRIQSVPREQIPHSAGTIYEYPSSDLRANKPITHHSPIQTYQSESFATNSESSRIQPVTAVPAVQTPHSDGTVYEYPPSDLRANKPIINNTPVQTYQPESFSANSEYSQLQHARVPKVYAPKVQNYAPVNLHTPILESQEAHQHENSFVTPQPFGSSSTTPKPNSYRQIKIDSPTKINLLYSGEKPEKNNDLQQYAAKYAFGYRILDEEHGSDFGHQEERDGHLTKGHYFVRLPDGRRQQVDYFVDKGGYHAKVSYDNVGRHPRHPGNGEEKNENLKREGPK